MLTYTVLKSIFHIKASFQCNATHATQANIGIYSAWRKTDDRVCSGDISSIQQNSTKDMLLWKIYRLLPFLQFLSCSNSEVIQDSYHGMLLGSLR